MEASRRAVSEQQKIDSLTREQKADKDYLEDIQRKLLDNELKVQQIESAKDRLKQRCHSLENKIRFVFGLRMVLLFYSPPNSLLTVMFFCLFLFFIEPWKMIFRSFLLNRSH